MLPTWDLVITIVFLVITAFNFILQRERIVKLIVGSYIGLALASVWSPSLHNFLVSGNQIARNFLDGEANQSSAGIGIFIISVLLLTARSEYGQTNTKNLGLVSPIALGIYSVVATLLIFASIIHFLDQSSLDFLNAESQLGAFLIRYQLWFFLLPATLLVLTGTFGKKRR
jgi:hypothetical protein